MTSVVQVVMLLSGVRSVDTMFLTDTNYSGGRNGFFRNGHDAVFLLAKSVSGTVSSDVPPSGDFKRNVYFFILLPPRFVRDRFAFCRDIFLFILVLVFFNFITKTDVDRDTITTLHPKKALNENIVGRNAAAA